MILHIFECTYCQRQQKHITSAHTPLELSYMTECSSCKKIRTYKFVREGNREEDWHSNIMLQVQHKQSENQKHCTTKQNTNHTSEVQANRVSI
jgi:hypothetical protein